MVETLSIAIHAVERTAISLNDTAVVVGSGMIGLLVIQILRIVGCGKIIAIDIDEGKLGLARQLGADTALNPEKTDIIDECLSRTNGIGADVVFEVFGTTNSIKTALSTVRKGGQLTLIGNITPDIEINLQKIVVGQVTINGSCASSGEYPICLDLIAKGKVNINRLISVTASLSKGQTLFERLYKKEPGLLKVILKP